MTNPTPRRASLRAKLLLALLALTLIAAGCGDGSADTTSGDTAAAANASDGGSAAEPSGGSERAESEDAPASTSERTAEDGGGENMADDSSEVLPAPEDEADTGTDGDETTSAVEDQAAEDQAAEDAADGNEPTEEGESAAEVDEENAIQRIVSISPTGTEMLFAIGAGDRVVAVDQFSYHPDEAPVTDLDGWNPNIEAIASYDPDLVVLQTNGEVAASLEALGITVFAHDAPFVFDDVYAQIEQLGAVTGQDDEAAALVAEMRADISELIAAAPDASGRTYYHELDNTLYSVTSSTFIGQVYALFGLSNVADPADADGSAWGYPQLSDEYLVDADPDLIFLADTLCCGQSAQTVAERPGWDHLTAVQTGRVVELNDDIVSRWGPRLVDFIAAISDVLVSLGAAS